METNLINENLPQATPSEQKFRGSLVDRVSALELQLKIYQHAELIGDIGNWQINLNSFETWYSDNTYRIYGIEPLSLKPHPYSFLPYIVEADREVVLTAFEKSFTKKLPLHLEYRIRREDGQQRHICIATSITKNANGEALLTGITQDITDRKNLEIQLNESAENLALRYESLRHAEQIALLGSWQVNLLTRQSKYSENYFRIFGLKPGHLSIGLEEFTVHYHPDDQARYKEMIQQIFAGEATTESALRIVRDDRIKYVRIKTRLFKNADADPIVIGVIKDITSDHKLEMEIKELNEKLSVHKETISHAEKATNIVSWSWDLDTNKLQVSDNIYSMMGLRLNSLEMNLKNFDKYIHPIDRPAIERVVKEMRTAPVEKELTFRSIRPDGKTLHLKTTCQPVISLQGHHLVIGTTRDITSEVVGNQKLKERIHFAEILSENIVDKICVTSASNIIIGWNKRSEAAFKLNKEEVLGRNIFDVFPKMKKPETISWFNRVLNGEMVYERNIRIEYLAGDYELTMLPIREEGNEVSAALMILHDITEHEKLKAELQDRLEFIERLIESSIHRVMVLDRNMNFLYWNKKAAEYYHESKQSVIGKNLAEIFPRLPQTPTFEKLREGWKGDVVHVPAVRESGGPEYFETFFIPIKNASQHVIGLLWMEHDLTQLIIAEKDLKKNRDLLQSIFDNSMTGIAVFESIRDTSGQIVDFEIKLVNEYGLHLFGVDIPGRCQTDVFPLDSDGGLFEMNKNVVTTGIPVDTERYYAWPQVSGWFRITVTKLEDGVVIGFDDISERKEHEEKLVKQRSLLMQAEEIAGIGTWELDPDTDVFTWSDQVFRIYDYSPQSFTPTLEFYLKTSNAEDSVLLENVFEAAKQGEKFSIQHRLRTLDGRQLDVSLNGHPVKNEFGVITALVGTLQDITDQKQVHEQLRIKTENIRLRYHIERQAEKLQHLGTWQYNIETGDLTWGESMFELFGLEPFSFKPTFDAFLSLIHPDDRKDVQDATTDAANSAGPETQKVAFRIGSDGHIRHMKTAFRKVSNSLEKFIVGTTMDFTEDVLLHQQLAERVSFSEALIESSIDRILALNTEFKIVAWNKRCQDAYDFAKEDVIGKHFFDVFPNFRENDTVFTAIRSALDGTAVYVPIQKEIYATGYMEGHYVPLKNEENEVYGVLCIVRDVTERIKVEQEMRGLNESLFEKNKELCEKNDELTSFAFIASHDLREPLRKVQVFSDRLLKNEVEQLTPAGKAEFKKIQAAVKRMDELIDDILNFSSINASDKAFVQFDLNQVLREIKIDMEEMISRSEAEIKYSNLPIIEGTASHFSHLLRNLLSNAIKYQPAGQRPVVTIESSQVKGSDIQHPHAVHDAVYLLISVSDNGIGFDQNFEHRIFQMFQRLRGMHEYPGTGMGLAICKKIAEIYQGFIMAKSAPNQGATFNCYFKLRAEFKMNK